MAKRAKIEQSIDMDALSDGISIDQNELDEALVTQPDKFWRVSKELALEISRRDEAKDILKAIEADIDQEIREEIREDPDKKKPAETEISRLIAQHEDVQAQIRELRKHDANVLMLTAIKESYLQRSYALKELVSLFLANYYGDNSERSQAANHVKNSQYDDNRKRLHQERERVRKGSE